MRDKFFSRVGIANDFFFNIHVQPFFFLIIWFFEGLYAQLITEALFPKSITGTPDNLSTLHSLLGEYRKLKKHPESKEC